MKLELNDLLKEISSWKNLLKVKNEETERFQKKLAFALEQNEVLEKSRANLFQEVTKLNEAVSSLRESFMKIEAFEEDKKILLEEKQNLKSSLESLEKLYYDEQKSMKLELQKLKEANWEETSKLVSEIQTKASEQLDSMKTELERKEKHIHRLKEEKNKMLKEKEGDILKLKIEYEDKISKLKQQLPKSRMQMLHGSQMHDVFRQKYLKLEKESEEEILKLKEQIMSLKLLADSFQARTSLSTAILSTSRRQPIDTAEVYTQTNQHDFSKWNACCCNDNKDFDFALNKKKINKHQSVVLPQKRKLFNLGENYYIK